MSAQQVVALVVVAIALVVVVVHMKVEFKNGMLCYATTCSNVKCYGFQIAKRRSLTPQMLKVVCVFFYSSISSVTNNALHRSSTTKLA